MCLDECGGRVGGLYHDDLLSDANCGLEMKHFRQFLVIVNCHVMNLIEVGGVSLQILVTEAWKS